MVKILNVVDRLSRINDLIKNKKTGNSNELDSYKNYKFQI